MNQAYTPLLKEFNLTYVQYAVLLCLWDNDNVKVGEITNNLKLDIGTISLLLKKMESKNLIVRERSKKDERSVYIRLTEKGKKLFNIAPSMHTNISCQLSLSEKKLIELKSSLDVLINDLSK